jgi:putative RNA 2'-phosphotransferase
VDRIALSKRLALILRHDPASHGVALDARGFADVDDLAAKLGVGREDIEDVVASSDKQRFALSPDGARIRASQGHSVEVDLGLAPREPPDVLWHGTVVRFVPSIREKGLLRGARTHVHLSQDEATAERVARRRAGDVVLIRVHARRMHDAGLPLYLSDNGVWLAEHVPPAFLDVA